MADQQAPPPVQDDPLAGLTGRQRRFVLAYIGEAQGNASEAARIAGYASPMQRGHEAVRNREVRAAIDRYLAQRAATADEAVDVLTAHLRADPTALLGCLVEDVVDVDGVPVVRQRFDVQEIKRRGLGRLVKKITPTKQGYSIELHDAQAAAVTLCKIRGLLGSDTSISLNVDPSKLSNEELDSLIARIQGRKG